MRLGAWAFLLTTLAAGAETCCGTTALHAQTVADVPVIPSSGAALKLLMIEEMPATAEQEAWLDSLKHTAPIDQLVLLYREPAFYAAWWAEVAACSGLPRRRAWRFGVVRAGTFPVDGVAQIGHTFARSRTILLTQPGADKRALVEHEMLHAVLYDNDSTYAGEHPDNFFGGKCPL